VKQARAFTLVEMMVVAAVIGVVSMLGFASMGAAIDAERARNEAARFAAQTRRQRAEAMMQQQYTLVRLRPTGGSGVLVTYSARRIGTPGRTPCEMMSAGDAESVRTNAFSEITIDLSTGLSTGDGREVCLDPFGRPVSNDLNVRTDAAFRVNHDGVEKLSVEVDSLGVMKSSDAPVESGIAQTSFYPTDLMVQESAPVPPNSAEVEELVVYEVAPGDYVDPDGAPTDDGALGGADDPCTYDSSYCDPCVIDPSLCDPCVVNPTSCGFIP
jgi:prepilin-type N-terminal cleavage/methylation domain-containing protein